MKKRVLLIDDDAISLNLLHFFLKKEFEVTSTSNGNYAMHLLDIKTFDVVVTDICMPTVNGYDILKKSKDKKNINVIAFSASFEEKRRDEFIKKGFFDFFIKPFDKEKILEIINRAV